MKGTKSALLAKMPLLRLVILAFAYLSLVLQTQAQIITLADQNSVAQVNTASSAGMFNWSVDGQNQLAQQWFWYRVGLTAEHAINTISAPSITTPDARTLYVTYSNAAYSVEVDYVLTGQTPGSGQADVRESVRVHNFTGAALDFHFFQYSDFDLGGTPGGDTVQLGKDISGKFNEALQTKAPALMSETAVTPGANHGEAALFNATLAKLNDANPDNLNDNAGPVTGDATWALQWDLNIAPGSDALISKQKFLQVPEPSTFALISFGAIACALHRRRQSSRGNSALA